ncbi:MAG: hypothetical protein E5V79_04235, partial [Mesorhizobium sp.]
MIELTVLEIAVARLRAKRAEHSLKQATALLDEDHGLAVSLALCSRIRAGQARACRSPISIRHRYIITGCSAMPKSRCLRTGYCFTCRQQRPRSTKSKRPWRSSPMRPGTRGRRQILLCWKRAKRSDCD